MKIGIKILPKKEVLDTQGRATLKVIHQTHPHSKDWLSSCHVGKYIFLEVDEEDEKKALEKAEKITKDILSNGLVETYELESL